MSKWILTIVSFLAVAGFIAGSVSGLSFVNTFGIRWVLLVVLVTYLMSTGKLFVGHFGAAGVLLTLYLVWCFSTALWSPEPIVVVAKSSILVLVTFAFVSAGVLLTRRWPIERTFAFIALISGLAIVSGLRGLDGSTISGDGPVVLFEGAVNGPNQFGVMQAMSLPLALWGLYGSRRLIVALAWSGVLATHVVFLYWSGSRASVLMAVAMVTLFFLSIGIRAFVSAALIAVSMITALVVVSPKSSDALYTRFILKGSTAEDGAFVSRTQVWDRSIEAAQEGGLIGLGYGVSFQAGASTVWNNREIGSFNQIGWYNREKGNSQLGILEETGVVGLFLYVGLIGAFLFRVSHALLRCAEQQTRVALGLVAGTMVGMVLHSFFEAWWSAPGSPEFPYFWMLCGIGTGLAQRVRVASEVRVVTRQTGRRYGARQHRFGAHYTR